MVLQWEGCAWARDLGGLPLTGGGVTRHGRLVRAGSLDAVPAAGWRVIEAHGIATVVDLRNDDERRPAPAPLPVVHVPLDGIEHRDFWDHWSSGPWFGTPVYYGPFLDRFPDRVRAALTAIAHAPPGGVLYHCSRGRDRTGLLTLVLLAATGVEPDAIVADYELSLDASGADETHRWLADQGLTHAGVLRDLLAGFDAGDYLGDRGLVARLRDRLVT